MTEIGEFSDSTSLVIYCRKCQRAISRQEDLHWFEVDIPQVKGAYHKSCWKQVSKNIREFHDALVGTDETFKKYFGVDP